MDKYKTNRKEWMKSHFQLFEKNNWNLEKVIVYATKNFVSLKYSTHFPSMIQQKTIKLGPVFLTYYVEIDSAQGVEDTDYFYLHFYIDFEQKNIFAKHDYEEKEIATDSLFTCYYEEDEIPDFTKVMNKHFHNHIIKMELQCRNNLYIYLNDFYTGLIA
ncbi:MAG: hypothetical protein L3J74_18720 [Bacteroidales bacterium]|nr:hypothetical protein [Bacteroidales bacterium]